MSDQITVTESLAVSNVNKCDLNLDVDLSRFIKPIPLLPSTDWGCYKDRLQLY